MATTIGTSTNLLVVSISSDLGLPQMSVFHFTPIVLMAALVALPFMWLVMPRLLPDNSVEGGHEPRRFLATLRLRPGSSVGERPLAELRKQLPPELEIHEDRRGGSQDGRLVVRGTHHGLEEAMRLLDATAAPEWLMQCLKSGYGRTGEDLTVVELSVTTVSSLIGHGVAGADVAERYNVAILGVHDAGPLWHGERASVPGAFDTTIFSEGDIILATGAMPDLQRVPRSSRGPQRRL